MTNRETPPYRRHRWALALALGAALTAGCTTADPTAVPTTSTPAATSSAAPVVVAGDAAVIRLSQAITARFGELAMSGQRTPDAYGDHARGLALDVMVPQWNTPAGLARGDAITAWVQSHTGPFRVSYTLWNRHYQAAGGAPVPMEDRGSPTANNLDHVHITVNPPGPQL